MRSWEEQGSTDTTCMGTKGYAAPEQFGFAQTDERTDIYALGCTFCFALTGVSPSGKDQLNMGVPLPLRNVLDKATAFDPAARYVWVGDFYADLKGAVRQSTPNEEGQQNQQAAETSTFGKHGSSAAHDAIKNEKGKSADTFDDNRQSFHKPGKGWRAIQLAALLFSLASIVVGIDFATGKSPSDNPLTSTAVAFCMFAIPLLILSDPFDILRKRGFFEVGTGKRFAQCIGVGFALSFLAAAVASVLADFMPPMS